MMPTKKLKLAMNNAMDRRREVLEGMKTLWSKLFICPFFSILGSVFLPRPHSMWLVARKSCGPATLLQHHFVSLHVFCVRNWNAFVPILNDFNF